MAWLEIEETPIGGTTTVRYPLITFSQGTVMGAVAYVVTFNLREGEKSYHTDSANGYPIADAQ